MSTGRRRQLEERRKRGMEKPQTALSTNENSEMPKKNAGPVHYSTMDGIKGPSTMKGPQVIKKGR